MSPNPIHRTSSPLPFHTIGNSWTWNSDDKNNYEIELLCSRALSRREPSNVEETSELHSLFFFRDSCSFIFDWALSLMNVYSVKYSWNSPFLDDLFPSFESSASNRCSPFSPLNPSPSLPPPPSLPSLPQYFFTEKLLYIENREYLTPVENWSSSISCLRNLSRSCRILDKGERERY